MKPTTLNEYYTNQGQSLPSVSARQGAAAQAGIQNYSGTAAQNTQLLGFLQNSGTTGNTSAPVIPATVATGNQQSTNLPSTPTSSAAPALTSAASAYINTIPKTGVANIDNANNAIAALPGQLSQQFDIQNKQTVANQAASELKQFDEETRVKMEQLRIDNTKTAASKQVSIEELNRGRAMFAGTLAIKAAFANQDYTNAKSLMNEQLQLELEPLRYNRDFFADMYKRTEDQKFQRAMKAEERAYQEKKAKLEFENEAKLYEMSGMSPVLPSGQPDIAKKVAFTLKAAKKDVPGSEAALGVLNSLQKFATENPEGRFIGAAPIKLFGKLRGEVARNERLSTRSNIEGINLKVQQWASGASLTSEQVKQVARLTPDKNDTDFQIKNKVNQLTDLMQTQIQSALAAKGVYYTPEKIDWFKNPLDSYVDTSIQQVTDPYEQYIQSLQGITQ